LEGNPTGSLRLLRHLTTCKCVLLTLLNKANKYSESEPLNADESDETEALILTAIEERVRERNKVNAERIRVGNTVSAARVFDRNSVVSLLILGELRLTGEQRRVFCRVVQHTRGGYQLTTKWGLLSGRFQHTELNRVNTDDGDIPHMTT
jgi:hypothetical protein